MATRKMTTSKPKAEPEATEAVVEEQAVVEEKKVTKKEVKKKHNDDDMIPCISVTAGELLVVGIKSKNLYSWDSVGDVVDVEYRDIASAIRSKRPCIFKPRFVIQDDDVIKEFPELKSIYDAMYSVNDLKSIFDLPPVQMERAINNLPDGAKDTVKSLAMTGVGDGSLDSIQRIRIIDRIFGTDMLLKLEK